MNKNAWISVVVAAVIFGGGGFYIGSTHASSQSQTGSTAGRTLTRGNFGGAAGFAGGGAGAFGGGTTGTIVQVAGGSFTVQLPTSTSSTATTGTKLVLVNDSTQIQELETVPASNIQNGQTVTVSGTANSDGSITASNVMVRPSSTRGAGAAGAGNAQ